MKIIKHLKREIEDRKTWEKSSMFIDGKNYNHQNVCTTENKQRFKVISIQIPKTFFLNLEKVMFKLVWNPKSPG